ncbi:hypothetical protein EVAR_48529_1 [Eumeta japonica]|uniref:Uncharacterized protein n=1 Tax=Eumeta variegata TaxID=151549 RepID=A0A4C1Y7X3_EUMVA|nr:hypothetical protein EVAR_48529_1 [Eumeta japonica]
MNGALPRGSQITNMKCDALMWCTGSAVGPPTIKTLECPSRPGRCRRAPASADASPASTFGNPYNITQAPRYGLSFITGRRRGGRGPGAGRTATPARLPSRAVPGLQPPAGNYRGKSYPSTIALLVRSCAPYRPCPSDALIYLLPLLFDNSRAAFTPTRGRRELG